MNSKELCIVKILIKKISNNNFLMLTRIVCLRKHQGQRDIELYHTKQGSLSVEMLKLSPNYQRVRQGSTLLQSRHSLEWY